jgi:hypothetical protein
MHVKHKGYALLVAALVAVLYAFPMNGIKHLFPGARELYATWPSTR